MGKLNREQLVQRFKTIKLLAIDVDGVLTDDSLYFGPDGFEMKKFNISDGFYMNMAVKAGLQIAIVSGRQSAATTTRMKDLGIENVLQGRKDKVAMLQPLLERLSLELPEVAFIGNEILDIKLAREVGLPLAVADAAPNLIEIVAYVTDKVGGSGAVHEVIACWFEALNINPMEIIP